MYVFYKKYFNIYFFWCSFLLGINFIEIKDIFFLNNVLLCNIYDFIMFIFSKIIYIVLII